MEGMSPTPGLPPVGSIVSEAPPLFASAPRSVPTALPWESWVPPAKQVVSIPALYPSSDHELFELLEFSAHESAKRSPAIVTVLVPCADVPI